MERSPEHRRKVYSPKNGLWWNCIALGFFSPEAASLYIHTDVRNQAQEIRPADLGTSGNLLISGTVEHSRLRDFFERACLRYLTLDCDQITTEMDGEYTEPANYDAI